MNQELVLCPAGHPSLRLRAVAPADAEDLRRWKNAQRQYFFFQEEISAEQQRDWLARHLASPDDFMFIVELDGALVGCMGFRLIDGAIDVYNVILGVPEAGGRGLMTTALRAMITHARRLAPRVGLKVLKHNPAVGFYEKSGFVKTAERDDHFEMVVDWQRFQPVEVT